MIVPCCGDLRELNSGHYHKIVEITENAGKCLLDEYVVRILEYYVISFMGFNLVKFSVLNKQIFQVS